MLHGPANDSGCLPALADTRLVPHYHRPAILHLVDGGSNRVHLQPHEGIVELFRIGVAQFFHYELVDVPYPVFQASHRLFERGLHVGRDKNADILFGRGRGVRKLELVLFGG